MPRLLIPLLVLLAGCRGGDENLGLSRSNDVLDLSRLDRPGRLERVLGMPAATVEKKLGPHRRQQSSNLTLTSGPRSETFSETWTTEFDGQGVHALHETSRDGGIEWHWIDGKIYSRLRFGRYSARATQGDEVDRSRDEQAHVLAGYLDVLGPFARRAEAGSVTLAGRRAIQVKLERDPAARPPEESEPTRAWRRTITVEALAGELAIDAASGAVLSGKLEATYSLRRGDKPITVKLEHRTSVSDLGAVARLTPPTDVVDPLVRPRPMLDRATLLEGLVTGRE